MRYETCDRGWIRPETVQLSIAEVRKRGWLFCPISKVPPSMQPAVLKHRQAYELAMHREELQQRYATGHWRPDPDPKRQPGFITEAFARVKAASNNSESSDDRSN